MIELPSLPAPVNAEPALIDFGGWVTPPLGGRTQRVDRLGNRFKIAVTMPPMPSQDVGRVFVRRLIAGKFEGVRMEYPLLSFAPGIPGNPVVNGNGQAGRSLAVRGFAPGYQVKEGQFFSHVHAGGRCLYVSDGNVTANGSGVAAVPISPMLRVQPADGDVLEFAQPMIEGFVRGEEWSWTMSVDHLMRLQFELEEFE